MSNPIIQVENIKKTYGEQIAVGGISFKVTKGECFALLGKNGAGKTTTCEILEGLILPDSGKINLFGLSYASHRKEILNRIGVQLQETSLYKKYTISETLALFSSFYSHVNLSQQKELIEKLGLSEYLNKKIDELSGGTKQKVYLVCALLNNPEILFLDEPTTGLDPQARRNLWEFIDALKKSGTTIVLTTHYLEEAEHLADTVAILDKGLIVASGNPKALVSNHTKFNKLSLQVSGEKIADFAKLNISAFKKAEPVSTNSWTLSFETENPTQLISQLMGILDSHKLSLDLVELKKASLEDVVLSLLNKRA